MVLNLILMVIKFPLLYYSKIILLYLDYHSYKLLTIINWYYYMLQNCYLHTNYIILLQNNNYQIQNQKPQSNYQLIYYLIPLYNHYYILHNIFMDNLYCTKQSNVIHYILMVKFNKNLCIKALMLYYRMFNIIN